MLKRALSFVLGVVFALCVAFTQPYFVDLANAEEPTVGAGAVKHVVLIGWDGLGSAYTDWEALPTLNKLKNGGAWTTKTRCVLPSVSAINWASILMGSGSELHGYRTWGSSTPDLPSRVLTAKGRYPDIFSVVHEQTPDALTASAYTWKTIGSLHESPREGYTRHVEKANPKTKALEVCDYQALVEETLKYLKDNPVLTFVYFDDPDTAGHTYGWGSDEYQKKLVELDGYVGEIVKYLEENDRFKDTVLLFVSDHGGENKGHGGETMVHMETPFIAYGATVKAGEIQAVVMNYDTAATIAWLLNLKQPQCWRGKPVESAFEFSR